MSICKASIPNRPDQGFRDVFPFGFLWFSDGLMFRVWACMCFQFRWFLLFSFCLGEDVWSENGACGFERHERQWFRMLAFCSVEGSRRTALRRGNMAEKIL